MRTVAMKWTTLLLVLAAVVTAPACVSAPRMSEGEFAARLAMIEEPDVPAREALAGDAIESGLYWEGVSLYEALARRTGEAGFARDAIDAAWELPPSPRAGSDELLILANGDVGESIATARFYARLRGIPAERIVLLSCPEEEEIERATFEQAIAAPLRRALAEAGGVRYLVVCFGIPLKVHAEKKRGQNRLKSERASVDSELMLLRLDGFDPGGMYANPHFPGQRDAAPSQSVPEGTPIFIVGRLDGPSALDAKMLVLRAVLAEHFGVAGAAYVDHSPGTTSYAGFLNAYLRRSAKVLGTSGRFDEVVVEPTAALLTGPCGNALAYEGWYSPKPMPGVFQWNVGAVAYHIYSFSARTLRDESWCSMMIREGVTATVGYVYEPYARNVLRGYILWDGLVNGRDFGESALRAMPWLSWMTVAIGDPLYRPFGNHNLETGKKEISLERMDRQN